MDYNQKVAVEAYREKTGRVYEPGEYVLLPIDALMFSEYQTTPWASLDEFKEKRCNYDQDTNNWLVYYVTEEMLKSDIPLIYVDITETGVNLVDGVHRVTAHLIAGADSIMAQLNKEN